MRALGRPVFAYSNDGRSFPDRIASFCGGAVRIRVTGEHEDADGMAIEPFALQDNLMLAGGVIASGGCVIVEANVHRWSLSSVARRRQRQHCCDRSRLVTSATGLSPSSCRMTARVGLGTPLPSTGQEARP